MLAETNAWDVLRRPEVAVFVVFFGTVAVSMVCIAWTKCWVARERSRVQQHQIELKQSMVDAGMSADEIERVIKAGAEDVDSESKSG